MTDPSESSPTSKRDIGKTIAIFSLIVGSISAVAAIVVIPEVRCLFRFDNCTAADKPVNPSTQQNGISSSKEIKIDGNTSVNNKINETLGSSVSQTGISASGPITINGSVTIGNTLGGSKEQDCSKPYLQLQLDDPIGVLVMSPDGDQDRRSRRFRLVIGNPAENCTAVVKSIFVRVEDIVEDRHPALEALTACYKLSANVTPDDKGKTITMSDKSYNYTPLSQPDQFVADIFSNKRGFAYGLRFGVRWTDLKTQKTNETLSWIALAPFPSGQGAFFGGSDTFEWRETTLAQWRRLYDKSNDAVEDATKKVPPIKMQHNPNCSAG